MATLTSAAIAAEVAQDFRDGGAHGRSCSCCERVDAEHPDLEMQLFREALYAVSRYRPGDGYLSDETEDSLDELADRMTDATLVAVHESMTAVASAYLAGKVARP